MQDPLVLALGPGRCSIEVRAQPGARQSGLVGTWNGRLKIAVRAPAQDGRANEELARVLAEALRIRPRELLLVRGEASRMKHFVAELSAEVALGRLRERLPVE